MTSPSTREEPAAENPFDDRLEAVLREGYGPGPDDHEPGCAGIGTLEFIRRKVGDPPRHLLRRHRRPESPEVLPGPLQLAELPGKHPRYQVVDEIARGGVGSVLVGRDGVLGRDVAIKVLLGRHATNDAMVRRFLEEAQIEGRLQHPGVVPVHEVGHLADERPFFTMKLVRGDTLSSLLRGRKPPHDERRRFLAVFEKVLDTIAYAHAQSVIHRDLKPSNIMVGAFGEVQVMDWGLSKVLGADEAGPPLPDLSHWSDAEATVAGSDDPRSETGSVMGTPAYMPPEQARGEVERVDKRSDVFSLGAILCEILTGAPPYRGKHSAAVREAARGAGLDRAHARLRGCGADPELIRIARRCIMPAREARYADARELAAALSAHLASLDVRARKAEVAAAEARGKAAEERRTRRLTVALAAATLLAFLVAGAAYFWLDASHRARVARTTAAVALALEDVVGLRGAAGAAPVEDVAPWDKALAALDRAEALAAQGDIEPATRARLASLASELRAEDSRARAASARALKDRAMVERLTRIESIWGGAIEWKRKNRAYREAFLGYGIDVEAESPEAVASRITSSRIAGALAEAIERWHWRPRLGVPDGRLSPVEPVNPPIRPRLMEIQKRIPRHPACEAVSSAAATGDWSAVTALIDEGSLGVSVSYLIEKLARWIAFSRRDVESAVSLLRACHARLPGDFWINYRLGEFLARYSKPPDFEEAMQHFRAAAAVRPDSAMVWFDIGWALWKQGKISGAQAAYRRVARLDPGSAAPLVNLGLILADQSRHEEALALYRDALRLDSENPYAHFNAGLALHRLNRTEEAAEAYRAAIRCNAGHFSACNNLGSILSSQGRKEEAIALYVKAVRINPHYHIAIWNVGSLKREAGDLDAAIRWFERYLAVRKDARGYRALGETYKLRGDVARSIAALEKAVELDSSCWQAWRGLGFQLLNGDRARSIEAFRRVVALNPGSARGWNNLGYALLLNGQFEEAVHAYRKVPPLLDAPDRELNNPRGLSGVKEWFPRVLRDSERAAELAPRVEGYVRGERRADDPRDYFVLSKVCIGEKRFAASTRFSMAAFEAAPELRSEQGARERAASGAARAAQGVGIDAETASAAERQRFRSKALQWLGDELAATTGRAIARGSRRALNEAVRTLKVWKTRPDFAGIRDAVALAGLSEEEESGVHAFWKELDAVLLRLVRMQRRVGYDFGGAASDAAAPREMDRGPASQPEEGGTSRSK